MKHRERVRHDLNMNQCDTFKLDNDCFVAAVTVMEAQHHYYYKSVSKTTAIILISCLITHILNEATYNNFTSYILHFQFQIVRRYEAIGKCTKNTCIRRHKAENVRNSAYAYT